MYRCLEYKARRAGTVRARQCQRELFLKKVVILFYLIGVPDAKCPSVESGRCHVVLCKLVC